ncbi:MAG TPA: farnesyl diphosphate synthase [Gemmataceae bacterium]|nr:farnesyl diphosphate synthase [Gemmataceae bacterium]
MSDALAEYLREKRAAIDSRLRAALQLCDAPARLAEAMRYSLLAPGKRLRPMLVLLAVDACAGREEDALPAACAVEMIHTYSLIHDDLPAMDDDDLRRGLPTCHVKFGEALAILAGDGLLTLAFQVLAEGYPARVAVACSRELARGSGAGGMVGGQVEDLAWERAESDSREKPSLSVLENIHALKTGALFRACLRMGAWAASAPSDRDPEPAAVASLDSYGRCFGQAFQITDDLLDVHGDAQQTGKQVRKDAARGKLTYPGLLGVTESRQGAERLCKEACDHVSRFGERADRLKDLAAYILSRDQ